MATNKRLGRDWLEKKARKGFRVYPIVSIAFYGPNDAFATKVVVGIVLTEGHDPDLLKHWFSEDTDVRRNPAIGEEVITFLKKHGVRSVAATDGIIGCPHEEGIDYPVGKSCPLCPYWAGRDRFSHERIH